MRYNVTPDFSKKLDKLTSEDHPKITFILKTIEEQDKKSLFSTNSPVEIQRIDEKTFVVPIDPFRVLFTMGKDAQGEYILILDLIQYKTTRPSARPASRRRDPRRNPRFNPNINESINPTLNRSLNPAFNEYINPQLNRLLNPALNKYINPLLNRAINPNLKKSLHPLHNRSINPKFNRSINPKLNPKYAGLFLYDLSLTEQGFFIDADENVMILNNMFLNFAGIAVKNSLGGYILFDLNNKWTGHLVPDKQGGYLHFDSSNQWIGFAV